MGWRALNMRKILAIDFGGTTIRMGDVLENSTNRVLNLATYPSPKSLDELLDQIKSEVARMERQTSACYTGIALAVAATVKNHEIVVNAPNLGIPKDTNFFWLLTEEIGLPSIVVNDMEAAAVGMAKLFGKHELSDFVAITWSSGVGLRLVQDGEVVYANTELAHALYDKSALDNPNAPICGCGRKGCYEAYLGGKQLEKRIVRHIQSGADAEANLGELFDNAYRAATPWAISLGQEVAEGMGAFLGLVQSIAATRNIVWKGSFAQNALPYLESQIREAMPRYMINPEWGTKEYLRFRFSPEPDLDALIGAASML